jgi:hypothetical protein
MPRKRIEQQPVPETEAIEPPQEVAVVDLITEQRPEIKPEDQSKVQAEIERLVQEAQKLIDDKEQEKPEPEKMNKPVRKEKAVETKPNRLATAARLSTEIFFRVEDLKCIENLEDILEGTPVIFCPDHMSDYSPSLFLGQTDKLPERFQDIAVADALAQDIDRNQEGDTNNFKSMQEALEAGHPLMFAAFYDPKYKEKGRLPRKGGNGAAYLSQVVEGAVLVPVAVDIKTKKPFGGRGELLQLLSRPKVEVKIGKPITPAKIEGIEKFEQILAKRNNGQEVTQEEKREFARIHHELQAISHQVMEGIAEMLPEEKGMQE